MRGQPFWEWSSLTTWSHPKALTLGLAEYNASVSSNGPSLRLGTQHSTSYSSFPCFSCKPLQEGMKKKRKAETRPAHKAAMRCHSPRPAPTQPRRQTRLDITFLSLLLVPKRLRALFMSLLVLTQALYLSDGVDSVRSRCFRCT